MKKEEFESTTQYRVLALFLEKKTSLELQRCRYNWIGLVHSKRGYSPSFGISSPCHAPAYLIDIPFIFFRPLFSLFLAVIAK